MSVTASVLEMSVIWSLMSMTDVSGRLLFLDRQVFGCVGREFELHIPWCKIVKIGPDIILVDIEEKEVRKKIQ